MFTVMPREWQSAKQFFAECPNKAALPNGAHAEGLVKKYQSRYCFVKINNVIYAMSNEEWSYEDIVDEGRYDRIRHAQDDTGRYSIIRIRKILERQDIGSIVKKWDDEAKFLVDCKYSAGAVLCADSAQKFMLFQHLVDYRLPWPEAKNLIFSTIELGYIGLSGYLLDTYSGLTKQFNDEGQSLLIWSCIHGHQGIVKYLLDEAPSLLEIPDKAKHTPLSWAILFGHLSIVRHLVDKNASLISRVTADEVPLLNMVMADENTSDNKPEMLEVLLSAMRRKGILAEDLYYGSHKLHPFHLAVCNNHLDLIEKFLLYYPKLLELPAKDNCRALAYAVAYRHPALVVYLLKHFPNIQVRINDPDSPLDKKTPLDIARMRNYSEIIELITAHEAKLRNFQLPQVCPSSVKACFFPFVPPVTTTPTLPPIHKPPQK